MGYSESWKEEEEKEVVGPDDQVSSFAGYLLPFPSWTALDLAANVLAMTGRSGVRCRCRATQW